MSESARLNKKLALALGISRREADEYIAAGRVIVNDKTATLGSRIHATDKIKIDDKPLSLSNEYLYLAFHKPAGYVCSRRQQSDTPTIYSLLPHQYHHLKPVGRLDKDSSGLLLLTNDGDFAHQMTHPKFQKTKVYEVSLDRSLEPSHHQMINDHGVQLEDGISRFSVEEMSRQTYRITMKEGRNRQIRRTFAALGYMVTKLHRIQFGTYYIDNLPSRAVDVIDIK
jgi:23S rRNA pseudouridine2605 synthase